MDRIEPQKEYQFSPNYLVTITVNENKFYGEIEEYPYDTNPNMRFDPLNVLADLSYTDKKIPLPDEEILASQYDYEYAFGGRIEIRNKEQYTQLVMFIRSLLKYIQELEIENVLSLKYVEILNTYYNLSFKFLPFDEIEPVYGFSSDYPPLFSFIPMIDSLGNCQSFKYACYSPSDIICSILHFLALKEYRIRQCPHCGRYFATHTNKIKYCSRNSPYPNYDHLNCEQAVRNIQQAFKREYKTIYNHMYKHHYKKLNEFVATYYDATNKVKEKPSIENIQLLKSVLDKKKWNK